MKTLLTEAELRAGVASLGEQIRERYDGRPLTLIAVMTGSLVFLADLIRVLDLPVRVGVIQASSYRGGMKAGELTTATDMLIDVAGHDRRKGSQDLKVAPAIVLWGGKEEDRMHGMVIWSAEI